MSLKNWAYIFISPGANPEKNRVATTTESCRFIAVLVSPADNDAVVRIAIELQADGAQLIELCGGFGSEWVTKVCSALGPYTPVGSTMYGLEWRKRLVEIIE